MLKCSGYRVEPAEIEAAVNAMPGVIGCAVVGIDDPASRPAPGSGSVLEPQATPADIRKALARQFPPYMQPKHCLVLEELPRLPNGKLDYQRVHRLAGRKTMSNTPDFTGLPPYAGPPDEEQIRARFQSVADQGALRHALPKRFRRLWRQLYDLCKTHRRLGEASRDPGLMLAVNAHLWGAVFPILLYGNETQREQFLPPLTFRAMAGRACHHRTGLWLRCAGHDQQRRT